MSTRSEIAMVQKDGTVKSIYCHFDGNPETQSDSLYSYYTPKKVEALINLGHLSSLEDTLSGCDAYGRDRGETGMRPLKNASLNAYLRSIKKRESWAEFIYVFNGKKWLGMNNRGRSEKVLMPLDELIEMEENCEVEVKIKKGVEKQFSKYCKKYFLRTDQYSRTEDENGVKVFTIMGTKAELVRALQEIGFVQTRKEALKYLEEN